MKAKLIVLATLAALLVVQPARSQSSSNLSQGKIVLTDFTGNVRITNVVDQKPVTPAKGLVLGQSHSIETSSGSSASLAFENGTVMQVEPDSKFVIQEFLQAAWDQNAEQLAEAKTEPSRSQTSAFLEFGDLVTGVKKLNPGSSLQVATPLGTAGIRGTDFKVTARRNADGTPKSSSVSVATGQVGFNSSSGGEAVAVPAGAAASVTLSPAQGDSAGRAQAPFVSQLSPQAQAAITQSVSAQRAGGQSVFQSAIRQSGTQASESKLTPEQRENLEDAADDGETAMVEAVKSLAADSPENSPAIAREGAQLLPSAAPQIAAAAASVVDRLAPRIAAAVASAFPTLAPAIAASVAQAVPAAAPQIAASVAQVAPSAAPQIASSVSQAVPDSAAAVARSVAQVQPQQAAQIADSIIQAVPAADPAAITGSAQSGAQAAGSGAGSGNSITPDAPIRDNSIPPINVPTPTPSPTFAPPATPTPIPSNP